MANDVADYTSSVVIQSGSVTIAGTATVTITGQPVGVSITGANTVILGAGTANVGNVNAINSTVTVAGTINIGNTPSVTISGTPNVNIGSTGSVAINGTPNINITQSAGLASVTYGNNLLTAAQSGPVTGGYTGENATLTFLANGTMQANNSVGGQMNVTTTNPPRFAVLPGQKLHARVRVQAVTTNDSNEQALRLFDAAGTQTGTLFGASASTPVGTWVTFDDDFVIPAGVYSVTLLPIITIGGGTINDKYLLSDAFLAVVGTVGVAGVVNINAINSTVTVAISGTPTVNIGNTPAVTVSGTVTVVVSSGTVSISGTSNINITSQSVTVNVNQPQTTLADLTFPAGQSTQTTAAVPAGTHSLRLNNHGGNSIIGLLVKGHQTGAIYWPPYFGVIPANSALSNTEELIVAIDSTKDTTYDVSGNASGTGTTLSVVTVLDVQAVEVSGRPEAPMFGVQVGRITGFGAAPFAIEPSDLPPPGYDGQAVSAPAGGSIPSVTLAATPGKKWRAHSIDASGLTTGATAFGFNVNLNDGVATIWTQYLGAPSNTNANALLDKTGMAFVGTANTAMTLTWSGNGLALVESVALGAYLF